MRREGRKQKEWILKKRNPVVSEEHTAVISRHDLLAKPFIILLLELYINRWEKGGVIKKKKEGEFSIHAEGGDLEQTKMEGLQ